ncbi:MAG: hypothetical protein KF800_11405 [Lysobacter sp.]|nr:hypothetical protein [Lysobacter sp.]
MGKNIDYFKSKEGIAFLFFALFFAAVFLLARNEKNEEWREIESKCIRDAYEMEKEHGGSAKDHEAECLKQHEEDQLSDLSR